MSPATQYRFAGRLVDAAAWIVPAAQREVWRQEWQGEMASLDDRPPALRRPVRRAAGAFADAFWIRQRSIADVGWLDDVRLGVRQLIQHRGFALSAIGI